MQSANYPADAVPADTFLEERRRKFYNGEAVEMFYEPNAVTDGDSIVHFRKADVIVAGDIFTTTQYPFIDVKNGGTVQGEIKALNDILSRTVFQHEGDGGTLIVPGHGYLSNEHEVLEYRDMVVIVRDRVQNDVELRRDARAGEIGQVDRRLRHALWREFRAVDDRHVRRVDLQHTQADSCGEAGCCRETGSAGPQEVGIRCWRTQLPGAISRRWYCSCWLAPPRRSGARRCASR
jgi:glyoxylase-like metal-dependent hydrolase (beta-lactamase superfamily II)